MISASHDDSATVVCFLEDQLIQAEPIQEVNLLETRVLVVDQDEEVAKAVMGERWKGPARSPWISRPTCDGW